MYTHLYLPYKSTKCSYIVVEVDFGGVTNWDDLPSRSKPLNNKLNFPSNLRGPDCSFLNERLAIGFGFR